MEGERGEFNDWEMLHNSDAVIVQSSDSTQNDSRSFDGIEGDSEGVIRSDYFSLDNHDRLAAQTVAEDDSAESDNPSWIDPAIPERTMAVGELWSDSASDRSDGRNSGDYDPKKESIVLEIQALDHASSDEGELSEKVSSGDLIAEAEGVKSVAEETETDDFVAEEAEKNPGAKLSGSEGEKRVVAWWKVPLEVLKFCAFKATPVWTFSVAAAVLGMVMLGKRLYRMKRKTQSVQLKVTMDDKKVSQFMSRVARLNEAFSVVKRVPIVRPALPSPGNIAPWPVMSLR